MTNYMYIARRYASKSKRNHGSCEPVEKTQDEKKERWKRFEFHVDFFFINMAMGMLIVMGLLPIWAIVSSIIGR